MAPKLYMNNTDKSPKILNYGFFFQLACRNLGLQTLRSSQFRIPLYYSVSQDFLDSSLIGWLIYYTLHMTPKDPYGMLLQPVPKAF